MGNDVSSVASTFNVNNLRIVGLWASLSRINVHPDADSIIEPGKKSAVSDPVPKSWYVDFDQFFIDMANNAKAPVLPWEYPVIKEHIYKEISPTESESVYVLSGSLLKSAGAQDHDTDITKNSCKVTIDYEKRSMVSWCSDTNETAHVHFLYDEAAESFRVEAWLERDDGTRASGEQWAWHIQNIFLKPHLFLRHICKVSVRALQEPPDGEADKVVLSGDLSEFFPEPSHLLDALVALMKKDAVERGGTVEYGEEESEVTLNTLYDFSAIPMANAVKLLTKIQLKIDSENHSVSAKFNVMNGETEMHMSTMHYKVYDNPVRLGFWLVRAQSELKNATFYESIFMAYDIHRLLQTEEELKELQSLDEDNVYF